MTANRNLKRRIRDRAARTGESYTAARHQLLGAPGGPATRGVRKMTVAVAQVPLHPDPADAGQIRASGAAVRAAMRQARGRGAGLILFPEGARSRRRTSGSCRAPEGTWAARCTTHATELAVADVVSGVASPAREWRRAARATLGGGDPGA